MNRTRVCQHIEELGIVPVVRARSPELAAQAVDALLTGGITVFEITLTIPGAVELIRALVKKLDGQALVGAGTVLTAEEAEHCIEAGARFIVSPGFDAELVELAHMREVAVMPGALTPTEVIRAARAGASMVKVFPCSALGGAKYLKALRGPLPHIKLLPTGGVNAQTARDYILAGACALGVGGELVDQQALEEGRASELSERARELLNAVREARSLSARKLEAS